MKKTLSELSQELISKGYRVFISSEQVMVVLGIAKGENALGQQEYDVVEITKDSQVSDPLLVEIQNLLK